MKKLLFIPIAAGLLVLSACSGDDKMIKPTDTTVSVSSIPNVVDVAGIHTIKMTVSNFAFTPNAVVFKKGEKAKIQLTDTTGIHGFDVKDLGINVRINPGETQEIDIPTDTVGTFNFRCSVPCGPGHKEMIGTIVIE